MNASLFSLSLSLFFSLARSLWIARFYMVVSCVCVCICISHINVACHVSAPINRDSYSMCWPCIRPKNQFQSHSVQYEGHLLYTVHYTICELCRNHLFSFNLVAFTLSPIVFHFSHPPPAPAHTHTHTILLSRIYWPFPCPFSTGETEMTRRHNETTSHKKILLARNINVPI